jgi:hypothetical protein
MDAIRKAWKEADREVRARVVIGVAGLLLMAVAIIAEFGFWGSLFLFGFVINEGSKKEGHLPL